MRIVFGYPARLPADVCDTHTFCTSVDLMLRGIHTAQLDAYTLEFESERDLTYATLLLSGDAVRSVSVVRP